MSEGIRIESDKRTQIEAETIRAGFLDQGFINTMRFSELNGPEEYDNTHLYVDWHACFEYGLMQLWDWREWITRQKQDPEIWATVPEVQKASIERTRSEEHTSELQSLAYLVCRLLLEKKKKKNMNS